MTSNISSNEEILFEVETPLGFRIRTTVSYWELITTVKRLNGEGLITAYRTGGIKEGTVLWRK